MNIHLLYLHYSNKTLLIFFLFFKLCKMYLIKRIDIVSMGRITPRNNTPQKLMVYLSFF